MYSHGLRSTCPLQADGDNAVALLGEFPFRDDMDYHSTFDIAEGFGTTLDERLVEGSRCDSLPESVHHHVLILSVQPHHLCLESVELFL